MRLFKVGTRGSALAMWQAEEVRRRLGAPSVIQRVETAGDRDQRAPLHEQGGAGFFTKELCLALLRGEADLGAHSLKDLPVDTTPGLTLAAILPRGPVGDMLLMSPAAHDPEMPLGLRHGAVTGTSAMRRRALLDRYAPHVRAVPTRGNVPTRVGRVRSGELEALVMARAGLARLELDLDGLVALDLNPARWIPAPGQAAVGVEVREDDPEALGLAAQMDHGPTRAATSMERGLLRLSGGGCHSAFAALAQGEGDDMTVRLAMPSADGPFRMAIFDGPDAPEEARRWVEAGAPTDSEDGGAWLWRPAAPWGTP